jgi:hypothetical protein
MIWLVTLAIVILTGCGLLLTPMVLAVDTRIPEIKLVWRGIGNAAINYKEEKFLLRFSVFFFSKEIQLPSTKGRKKKTKKPQRKKSGPHKMLRKFLPVVKSFRVPVWKISLDTGDYMYNGLLYPLNYFLGTDHCNINFNEQTYLVLELRNNLGRMLLAWMR